MKMVAFCCLLSSCKLLVGVKKPLEINASNFEGVCKQHRVNSNTESYFTANRQFSNLVHQFSIDTSHQNYLQPLQLIVFDSSHKLVSHLINCNVGGFPKLKWNRRASFDQIPVLQNGLYPSKAVFNMQFLSKLTSKEFNKGSHDYYYFVIWSRILGYNSKKFIRLIQENLKLNESNKISLIYINIDNEYLDN